MGFGAPGLTALAALAAIPLVIHILSRIRLRRAEFPSLLLLSTVKRERFSWLRLKELLLLVLRTLALLFLLLAPSRPYLKQRLPALGRAGDLVVVIDDSYSMGYGGRWQRALAAAARELRGMGPGQRAVLMLASEPPAGDRAEWRRPVELAAQLDSLAAVSPLPAWSDATLEPALRRAVELARGRQAVVLAVTDLQQRAIPDTWQPQSGDAVTLLDVGAERFDNAGIASLTTGAGAGQAGRFRAELVNHGQGDVTRAIRLAWGDRRDERVVTLPAGGRVTVEFDASWTDSQPGFVRAELQPDSLGADDTRWLAIVPIRRTRTLVLESDRVPARYLVDALGQDSTGNFDFVVAPVTEFGRHDPRNYPVIVVTDAAALGGAGWERLAFHLQAGGAALVMAPTPPADVQAARGVLAFLPAGPAGARNPGAGWFVSVDWVDSTSAVLDPVTAADLGTARFFAHARLDPSQGRVLARLSDRSPLLLELEQGRLVAAAFGAMPEQTDLVYRAAFVPLLHRTLAGLAGARLRTNYEVGDTARVPQPKAGPVDVFAPGRYLQVTAEGGSGRPVATIGPLSVPGEWRAGGQPFAVNVVADEGDLTRVEPKRCAALGYRVATATGAGSSDLSQLLLWLALAAFAAEMLLLAL